MTMDANRIRRDSARRYWMILLGVFLAVLAAQGAYLFYLHEKSPEKPNAAPGPQPAHAAQSPEYPAAPMFDPIAPFPDPWSDPWQDDVFVELSRMQLEMDRLFEEAFARLRPPRSFSMFAAGPRFNLNDDGDRYVVTVETGGGLSEVKVEVKDDALDFSAKQEAAAGFQPQGGLVVSRSSSIGTIHQSIRFPGPVDPGSLRTEYSDTTIRLEVKKRR